MKIQIELNGQPTTFEVPEGMDPQDYANQVEDRHYGQEQYSAASDSDLENFQAGMGQGMANIGRQAGNMVGMKGFDDEALARSADLDSDLLDTTAGAGGALVGEIAATLPLSAGVAAGGRAVAGASRLPKALRAAGASTPAQIAVEGAGMGALVGGPDNRIGGAVGGAALGGTLGYGGRLAKNVATKPWVKKSKAALDTEAMTGKAIPLSQSADPIESGLWKQIYEGWVANMPGPGNKLRKQYGEAVQDFREFVVEEAAPPTPFGPDLTINTADDMQDIMGKLIKSWDEAYDFGFKTAPVVMFKETLKPSKYWKKLKPAGALSPKAGEELTGAQVLSLKKDIQSAINELPAKESYKKADLIKYKNSLDDLLKQNFNPTGKGKGQWAQELDRYHKLEPYYKKYQDVLSAAAKDPASLFTPKQLLSSTNKRAGKKGGVSGHGALNKEAKPATEALKDFPSRQGIFQSMAAVGGASSAVGGILGGLVGGPMGAVAGLGVPYALARVLARPGTQKLLAGETRGQKGLNKWMQKHRGGTNAAAKIASRAAVGTAY